MGRSVRRGACAAMAVVVLLGAAGCSKSSGGSDGTTTTGGAGDGSTVVTGEPTTSTTEAAEEAEEAIMPGVLGSTEDEARAELADRGVEDDDILVDERESLEKAGTVIDQVPSEGNAITGSVNLVVAKPIGNVPDFVGKPIADVREWAEEREIDIREVTVLDDTLDEGQVISTTPKAGQKASSEIAVEVASKPIVGQLADVTPTTTERCEPQTGEAAVNGDSIQDSVMLRPPYDSDSPCIVEYDFGRDWTSLKGTLGIIDDSPTNTKVRLQVFGDEKELLNVQIAFATTTDLDLDVTDVLRLKVQVTYIDGDDGYDDNIQLALGNLRRIGSPGEVPETTTTTTP